MKQADFFLMVLNLGMTVKRLPFELAVKLPTQYCTVNDSCTCIDKT